jgi:hypothetical protein
MKKLMLLYIVGTLYLTNVSAIDKDDFCRKKNIKIVNITDNFIKKHGFNKFLEETKFKKFNLKNIQIKKEEKSIKKKTKLPKKIKYISTNDENENENENEDLDPGLYDEINVEVVENKNK